MSDKIIKFLVDPEIKEIDEKKRTITHKISTEKKDRGGDIVRVDGIDTKDYKKNPVVLYSHDYWSKDPLPVIGKNVGFIIEGKKLFAKTQFLNPDEVSPKLRDLINDLWYLNKNKLMGWSIGFIPTDIEDIKDKEGHWEGYDFKESDLLEYSNVIIPMNQEAVNNAFQKGMVSKECVEGMACFIEKQELPGDVATKQIEEERTASAFIETAQAVIATLPALPGTKEEKNDPQIQGITPDSIKALRAITGALKDSQELITKYLQKFTGGKQ